MSNLTIRTPHQILLGVQIGYIEMGGACNTYGGEERCTHGFGREI